MNNRTEGQPHKIYNHNKQTNKKKKKLHTHRAQKIRITPLQKHCNKRNVETTLSNIPNSNINNNDDINNNTTETNSNSYNNIAIIVIMIKQ